MAGWIAIDPDNAAPEWGAEDDRSRATNEGLLFHPPCLEGMGAPYDPVQGLQTTLANAPTWGPGQRGPCLTYNGTNQRMAPGRAIAAGLSGSFSFAAWVNPGANSTAVQNAMTSEVNSGYTNYWAVLGNGTIGAISNKGCFGLFDGTHNPLVLTQSALTLGRWTHLVGVRDAARGLILIYQDGVLQNTAADTTTAVPTYGNFFVGGQVNVGARFFPGSIADPRVYGRALSGDEADRLANHPYADYLGGVSRQVLLAPPAPGWQAAHPQPSRAVRYASGGFATAPATPAAVVSPGTGPLYFRVAATPVDFAGNDGIDHVSVTPITR